MEMRFINMNIASHCISDEANKEESISYEKLKFLLSGQSDVFYLNYS